MNRHYIYIQVGAYVLKSYYSLILLKFLISEFSEVIEPLIHVSAFIILQQILIIFFSISQALVLETPKINGLVSPMHRLQNILNLLLNLHSCIK